MRKKYVSRGAQKILFLVLLPSSLSLWAQPSSFSAQLDTAEENPGQVREDLQTLQMELARIESEFDAYSPAIAEVSLDIGNRLADRGYHSDALVAYRRALHVLRVNEGLESVRQIPILENIVETHYRGGQYEDAGDSLERLSRLYSKTYDRMNPGMIPHLIDRGDWHLGAYHLGYGRNDLQHLVEAHNAYSRVAEIRETVGMPYDPDIYKVLSSVNYNMAVYVELSQSQLASSNTETQNTISTTGSFAGNSYRRGKTQLEKALSFAKASPNQSDEIQALVQLADWEQIFRKRFSAREKYLEAYQKLAELGTEHELSGLFNRPKKLPDFKITDRVQFAEDQETTSIPITLDVSAWGTSRNVSIVETEEDNRNARAERVAVRTANASLFRPVIVDGEPVKSENVNQNIVVRL